MMPVTRNLKQVTLQLLSRKPLNVSREIAMGIDQPQALDVLSRLGLRMAAMSPMEWVYGKDTGDPTGTAVSLFQQIQDMLTLLREVLTKRDPAINIFVEIQAAGWGGKAETVTKMLDIGATMKPTKITAYGHTQTMNGVMALEATVMTGMTGTAEAYATIGVTANGHSHRMNGMTALQLRAGRTEAQLRTLGITKKVAGHIPRPIGMDGLMEHRAKTMKRTGLLGFPHTQCRLGLLRSKVQRWDPADTEAEKHFWDQTYLRQFTGTHLLESIAFIAKESATQTVSQNMV